MYNNEFKTLCRMCGILDNEETDANILREAILKFLTRYLNFKNVKSNSKLLYNKKEKTAIRYTCYPPIWYVTEKNKETEILLNTGIITYIFNKYLPNNKINKIP